MTIAGVLLLASMLPVECGEPAIQVTADSIEVGVAGSWLAFRPPHFLALEGPASSTPDAGSEQRKGWPPPLKLLVAEGSIAALSSCGYISEWVGEPPETGAYVLGSSLVGLGAFVAILLPWALVSANTAEDREGDYVAAVACVAVIAAGAYNLYLHNNHDPGSARIFRDNMIALNAVPLVTWGSAKIFHWSF